MLKFVVDENVPRSTSKLLIDRGFEVLDIRDSGLRGKSDKEIFEFAEKEAAIIITADLGFGNVLHYPPGSHHGILILHFPNEISTVELNKHVGALLENLTEKDLKGNLVILEPGKIRVRKK